MKTSVKIGRKYWHKLLFIFGLLIFANCRFGNDANEINLTEPQVEIDLPQVMERGKLIALTGYDVTSYFIYKGRPMGFEYDLLNRFANHLGVELEIVVIRDLDRLFDELNKGRGDLLAYNLTITQERQERVMFTDHHTVVRQVLIQRLPKNWRNMPQYKIDRMLLRNSIDLIGKTVHVRKGSSYYERLQNLEQEIGGDIDIVEVPGDVTTEELIRRVADGEIDYTVADENIAWINSAYYDNIDTQLSISVRQRIAWSVRKNSPLLRDAVNEWLSSIKSEPTFNIIYNKYYRNRDFFRQRLNLLASADSTEKISPFDSLFQKFSANIDWDWRLIAAQAYKESRFDPKAESWAGAMGLMQITPTLAEQYGVENPYNPTENLKAGLRYLRWLEDFWQNIEDAGERLKFVLASYNVGQGHVLDAQRLAEKYGGNPDSWADVSEYLIKKSQPQFYNDEVVKHGYCRGEEPVQYVRDVLYIYEHYLRFAGE